MGEFFVYILKSSFCLALFYLFYRLLCTRETFHRFNRIGILALLLLSIVIPLVEFSVKEPVIVQQSLWDLETLLLLASMTGAEEAQAATPLWIRFMLWVYLLGCLNSVLLFFFSCFKLSRIIRKGRVKKLLEGNIRLVVTSEAVAPFSWIKWIVISEKDFKEGGEEIITHELAHIRARHSLDLLVTEICIVFHWFNPAIWLFKQELQNIHEYEADEKVLEEGVDAKRYQLLLIKKAVGSQRFTSMANSFNHRSLKKRISMMLKRKSNPWARLKYIFVLPLAAITVVAFARPEISHELEKISTVKISEIVPVAEISKPKKVKIHFTADDSVKVDPKSNEIKLYGQPTLKEEDIKEQQELIEQLIKEQQPELEKMVKEQQALMEELIKEQQPELEKLVKEQQTLMEELIKEQQPEMEKLVKEQQVLMEELIKEQQPELEKLVKEQQVLMEKMVKEQLQDTLNGTVKLIQLDTQPLLIVDGKVQTGGIDRLKANNIESVSVVKNKSAEELYGERGRNGVILVTTKNRNADPLLVIDGEIRTYGLIKAINPETVESISILKDETAVNIYGEKARDGVIIVTTKDKKDKKDEEK
ncbi:TonB-dependent SusC/RagA subfamily outer membrane receptor [Parabacteroides sp. PFB2-12]|uniref:M56 family metallopeptidase n=1 Tax=unclassified Parabacteroides TaxID=2649774 RepID=UPI002473E39E|nr:MULTISPECIES: M56 family metallopeptidase [unclassified Parabacteroides]MDH6342813.1 TonB-dependent SusC/RagA subfamily outer membrane receptor [Parabacteroides sp. PM6-13]MDH6390557.1 TonB-dependent SusC/RagA subfamily outer membrane receptor [Parabacteroides sp. PFB2-12]